MGKPKEKKDTVHRERKRDEKKNPWPNANPAGEGKRSPTSREKIGKGKRQAVTRRGDHP